MSGKVKYMLEEHQLLVLVPIFACMIFGLSDMHRRADRIKAENLKLSTCHIDDHHLRIDERHLWFYYSWSKVNGRFDDIKDSTELWLVLGLFTKPIKENYKIPQRTPWHHSNSTIAFQSPYAFPIGVSWSDTLTEPWLPRTGTIAHNRQFRSTPQITVKIHNLSSVQTKHNESKEANKKKKQTRKSDSFFIEPECAPKHLIGFGFWRLGFNFSISMWCDVMG